MVSKMNSKMFNISDKILFNINMIKKFLCKILLNAIITVIQIFLIVKLVIFKAK